MIGNDIVDLALAKKESNWKRKGYLDKIFTKNEQLLIASSENPDVMVWNLWSRKEAVYKIVNRAEGIQRFNPLSFNCCFCNAELNEVRYKNEIYYTQTETTANYVHTIAVQNLSDFHKIIFLEKSEIIKENLLPYYTSESNQLLMASLSHHGKYYFAIGLKV